MTRTSSRVKALARVARPIGQHGTVVGRIPPMATSAPSSRREDPESASPRAGTEALDPPLSSAGAMPALSHLTEQALHRAGHDRAQKARLCVATVAQSTCPRSTPNAGSARGYQGVDRSLSRPVCPNR